MNRSRIVWASAVTGLVILLGSGADFPLSGAPMRGSEIRLGGFLTGGGGEELLLLLLLVGAVIGYFYRSRQKAIYHRLYLKEKELRESFEASRTSLEADALRVENQLRESNDRLHRAEAVAMIGNWNLTLGDNIMHISDGVRAIYGIPQNDLPLHEAQASVLPEYRPRLDRAMRELLEATARYDVEFKIRDRSTGAVKSLHSKAEYDERSKTVFGVIQDITARKHTEDTLRTLSRSVEQSPASIVITDLNGNIEYVNPKFTEVSGYTMAEVLGRNPRFLKSGNKSSHDYETLWTTVTSGREWRGEFLNKKKNGDFYWESALIAPITDEAGVITHYLAVKENITERKLLEEQLFQSQKMEGVGALAGGIAHDFNNLLAMILGSAELLRQHAKEKPELRKYADRIIEASERGSSISRQLLIFSRPDQMELQPVSMPHMVSEIRELLKHFLPKSISVETELEAEHGIILADAGQIHQALLNLALNGRDAMPEGGTLTMREFLASADDVALKFGIQHTERVPYVAVRITDTGAGIDSTIIGKIFDPFFTTKEPGKGTGLGLSTVQGIVKNHKGFIGVESTPGCGTTFSLYFPLHADGVIRESPANAGASPRRHGTILLVDDENSLREMLAEYLHENGYTVHTASNGVLGLEKFREHAAAIDLVVTDLGMPEMGGEELISRLKRLAPEMKVIVISGYLDGATRDHLLKMGVGGLLKKPFRLTAIGDEIQAMLG